MGEPIEITGYKGRKFRLALDWYAADENGRGGKVVWVMPDAVLEGRVIGVIPKTGPGYELRESMISFTAPPDDVED
jgi:hypothetical protein